MRIRDQLYNIALGVRAFEQRISSDAAAPAKIEYRNLSSMSLPSSSPYGGTLDMLWLGHCGAAIPDRSFGRVVHQEKASTEMIRWSARMNLETSVYGRPLEDQFPDKKYS